MGRSRYKLKEDHYPYFITFTARHGLPLFAHHPIANTVLKSLEFVQKNRQIQLFSYVIMENHIHLVISGEDLSKKIRLMKSHIARETVDQLKREKRHFLLSQLRFRRLKHKSHLDYQVWEEGYHPIQIFSDDMMRQKIEYIHSNPVRRGYVDIPEHWRYSSARNYTGVQGLVSVTIWGSEIDIYINYRDQRSPDAFRTGRAER